MSHSTENAPGDQTSGAADLTLNPEGALRFLELLGKDPANTYFRTIRRGGGANKSRRGADLKGFDLAVLQHDNATCGVYCVVGEADVTSGGGGGVTKADVRVIPAVFIEYDDRSINEQLTAWETLGLPRPTFQVETGGKSIHSYWVLDEAVLAEEWETAQQRLIAHCGSDKSLKDPSRVMRVPGFTYFDKANEATGTTRLINVTGTRYTLEDVLANVPELPAVAPAQPPSKTETIWEPRGVDEIFAAAAFVRERVRGGNTYPEDRNVLCGCSVALAEAGVPDPDNAAVALLGPLWPSMKEARDVLKTTTTRNPASFWAVVRDRGYQFKLISKNGQKTTKRDKPLKKEPRMLPHSKAMACFERCVEVQAKRERNTFRRRARLLKAAKDLGLRAFIDRQEIAQRVLEAKAKINGEGFAALTATDRAAMGRPKVSWLLSGILPAGDLTIIGGRPKVGKTRLAMAMAAAVLNGEGMFDLPAPLRSRPVVLVTDDQSDADTAQMLQELKVWDHPLLIWSCSFRLTEFDLDALLQTVKANPGALVVLDSLRSISRALSHGENDPEIGATLYDLKQAVIEAGGTLLLIHHCNKTESLVGVEALSGHSAIAGAANTVLTLHYIIKGNGQLDKSGPERRLFREARTGDGFDVVVTPNGARFRKIGTHAWWQQQLNDAHKKKQQIDKLTPTQQDLLKLIQESPHRTFTRRELVESLELEWSGGNGPDSTRVRESLKKLVQLELISEGVTSNTGGERVFCTLA